MSDSSRHSLFAVAEVAYGTTPATPALKTIRHTGTNLGLSKSTMVSEELRSDRQIQDFRHGTKQVGGDISGELSYGSFDDFLEAVLCGTWTVKAAPRVAITISAASADNSINDSANLLPLLAVGDRVALSGFTAGAATNNQNMTVVSSTAGKLILSGGVALVTQAAGASYTVTPLTQVLKAGVVRRSFSILRNFSDLAGAAKPFYLYSGVEFNKWTLTVAVSAIIKTVFSVIGQAFNTASTAPAGSTFPAANSNAVMDSFSGLIYEGGAPIAVVTEQTLTLENGIEPRFVIGSPVTIRPSIGRSNLTSQITAYFEDSALVDKFVNETTSSLVFNLADLAGNGYRFTLPRLKYNGGQPDTQGQGSITLSCPIQGLYDPVTGTNIIVEKNPA